jgi:lysozyme
VKKPFRFCENGFFGRNYELKIIFSYVDTLDWQDYCVVKKEGYVMQKRCQGNLKGIDVSHWQGDINWEQVRNSGVEFAFIKATEGSHYVDPLLRKNAQEAIKAHLNVGFYHFARFNNEGAVKAEAHHFIKTIHQETSQLPHVLDLEVTNGLDKTELSRLAKAFLDLVHAETGKDVMLYTNTNMAKRHLTSLLKEYPLWIAHYGVDRPDENEIWKKWQVFQYTSKGNVPGIKGYVDLDEMVPEWMSDEQASKIYKIRKGDTFWELEDRYGLRHGVLQKLNPDLDPRHLQVGDTILLQK